MKLRNTWMLALVSTLASGAIASDAKSYSGKIVDAPVEHVTLSIGAITSDDDTFALAETLLTGGASVAAAAVAKLDAGTITLGETTFRANVIRTLQTDAGLVIAAVSAQPLYLAARPEVLEGGAPVDAGITPLGYLEFTVDEDSNGTGRILPAVQIVFGDEGYMQADNIGGITFQITGVSSADLNTAASPAE